MVSYPVNYFGSISGHSWSVFRGSNTNLFSEIYDKFDQRTYLQKIACDPCTHLHIVMASGVNDHF